MNPFDFLTQMSARHGLVGELRNEPETLTTALYPFVHRFLLHRLTRRMAQVARSACSSLTEPVATPVAGAPPVLGEHQSQRILAILRAIVWHFHPRKQKSKPLLKHQQPGKNPCCQQCGKPLCLRCQGCSNRDCHAQTVLYCLCVLVKPREDEELRGDSPVSGRAVEE